MDTVWVKYGKGRLQEWMAKRESTLSEAGNKTLERVTVCELTIGSVGVNISKIVYCCANRTWLPVPVAARSKAVCGGSPAEIVGSNPTGGTDVCL